MTPAVIRLFLDSFSLHSLDFCYNVRERTNEMNKWKVTTDAYYDEYNQHENECLEFKDKQILEKWFIERIKRWTNNWTMIVDSNMVLEVRNERDALNIKIHEIND